MLSRRKQITENSNQEVFYTSKGENSQLIHGQQPFNDEDEQDGEQDDEIWDFPSSSEREREQEPEKHASTDSFTSDDGSSKTYLSHPGLLRRLYAAITNPVRKLIALARDVKFAKNTKFKEIFGLSPTTHKSPYRQNRVSLTGIFLGGIAGTLLGGLVGGFLGGPIGCAVGLALGWAPFAFVGKRFGPLIKAYFLGRKQTNDEAELQDVKQAIAQLADRNGYKHDMSYSRDERKKYAHKEGFYLKILSVLNTDKRELSDSFCKDLKTTYAKKRHKLDRLKRKQSQSPVKKDAALYSPLFLWRGYKEQREAKAVKDIMCLNKRFLDKLPTYIEGIKPSFRL